MNATDRARRSDSLYYDTTVTSRRALCDMIANIESDLQDAKAENAKLQKLVKDVHALATDHGVYVQYPYCDAWDEKLAVAEKQMRELGIEVNG